MDQTAKDQLVAEVLKNYRSLQSRVCTIARFSADAMYRDPVYKAERLQWLDAFAKVATPQQFFAELRYAVINDDVTRANLAPRRDEWAKSFGTERIAELFKNLGVGELPVSADVLPFPSPAESRAPARPVSTPSLQQAASVFPS